MDIVNRARILKYQKDYPNAKDALSSWYDKVLRAKYEKTEDVHLDWGPKSTLNAEVAVFDIKGNSYRLIVRTNYKRKQFFVRWFGTHAEYDELNKKNMVLTI